MTNFSKILNQMGAMYSDERYRYIASFNRFSLLIIDDLGIERNTEYALEQVYAVIDERYKTGLPLIITTNLTISSSVILKMWHTPEFTAGYWRCVRRYTFRGMTGELRLENQSRNWSKRCCSHNRKTAVQPGKRGFYECL